MTHLLAGVSLDPIAKPIAAILAAIYSVVPNYGVAILVLSVAWMLLISPLTLKSTRSMLAMQKLQPQIKRLQEQHKNDRAALSQATMDLYREEGVSPFGSCLPSLLPLPVFFALFRVIDGLSHKVGSTPSPRYLSHSTQMYRDIVAAHGHLNAFGLDLSQNALGHHSSAAAALPYFAALLLMIGTQYWQTVQMLNRNPANADNPQVKMMKYLPIVFGVICIRFPAGVVIYYAMSNLCRVAQQTLMYRFDPKVRELAVKDAAAIEAETRDIESGRRPRAGGPAQPAGRSRFRELLAAAAEQQEAKRQAGGAPAARQAGGRGAAGGSTRAATAKVAATGSTTGKRSGARNGTGTANGNGNGTGTANGNGNGTANGTGNGAGAAGARGGARTGAGTGRTGASQPTRTNRKRRGR